MNALDHNRLAKVLGLTGSAHDGEALAAVRKANALIVAAGMTWDEIVRPPEDLSIAVDAVKLLLNENEALRNEIEGLRRGARDRNDWRSVRDHCAEAHWCLGLHADGEICLNDFDQEFLSAVSRWSGELPKNHEATLSKVVADVCRRTGHAAP
jgi:hypothetical protein